MLNFIRQGLSHAGLSVPVNERFESKNVYLGGYEDFYNGIRGKASTRVKEPPWRHCMGILRYLLVSENLGHLFVRPK